MDLTNLEFASGEFLGPFFSQDEACMTLLVDDITSV